MGLPFVLALTALIYLKPQEVVPALRALPMLYLVFGLAIAGVVMDLLRGGIAARLPAQAPYVLAFAGWSLVDIIIRDISSVPRWLSTIGVGVGIYLAVALAAGNSNGVRKYSGLLLVMAVMLAAVGAHQSTQPFVCFGVDYEEGGIDDPIYHGHPCETWRDCMDHTGSDSEDWICERAGLLGTSSVAKGRVRYRGSLADPNELALVVGSALPFGFALHERKRTKARLLLLLSILGLAGWAIIRTESRGGQLVFATVMGLYFIRRLRIWGAIVGCVVALPVVLLGGRSGASADASAMQRVEAWYEAIDLVRFSPVLGVGPGLFTDYHYLTAHNAYLLVVAETGIVGFYLWLLSVYMTAKIPAKLWWARDPRLDPVCASVAPALLVAFAGLFVGIFFLSFAYHHVLYLFMGLAGALGLAASRKMPDFELRISAREMLLLGVGCIAFLGLMFVYTRLKVG